jgi:hypothetical protein
MLCGDSQIAGQSQSPIGSLAVTSTRPYLMVFLPFVVSLADRTGGIMFPSVELEVMEQEDDTLVVQEPSPPAAVMLSVCPL